MALSDPQRGIMVVLKDGPMTTAQLEKRVPGAGDILLIMEREGLVVRDRELWGLAPIGKQ